MGKKIACENLTIVNITIAASEIEKKKVIVMDFLALKNLTVPPCIYSVKCVIHFI